MAKQTLLEIVQDLLSDMDSDEANSISDSVEADQVARVVRRVYLDMVDELSLGANGDIIKLEEASTPTLPTRLKIPENTGLIEWIKYSSTDDPDLKEYKNVVWKSPTDFINLVTKRTPDDPNVQLVDYSPEDQIQLIVANDTPPRYWTSFDDEYIWFDSWDSAVSSTIVANHTMAFANTAPTFTLSDSFVPDLPANLFPYLYAKAKSVCFNDLKQSVNPKAEQTENRLRIRSQRNKWRQGRINQERPNYGKRP